MAQKEYTNEEVLAYIEYKGYEVSDDLAMLALAESLGFEYNENTDTWKKG